MSSEKYNLFYGIKSTSSSIHFGHVIHLINIFKTIKKEIDSIDTIYILFAETHSEISKNIPFSEIRNNSIKLKNQIISLMSSYFDIDLKNLEKDNKIFKKIKFIFQNDHIQYLSTVYSFLPFVSTSKMLKNPIFKKNENNSIAFLIYPILQAFDVILYSGTLTPTYVCVGNDQKANVNIMKDVYKKLGIYNIKFNIYENVINGFDGNKMSKSENNTISFDVENIPKYITKYKTCERKTKDDGTNHNLCNFYKEILSQFYYKINDINIDECVYGQGCCKKCKDSFINKITYMIENFNKNIEYIQNNEFIFSNFFINFDDLNFKIYNNANIIYAKISELRKIKQ